MANKMDDRDKVKTDIIRVRADAEMRSRMKAVGQVMGMSEAEIWRYAARVLLVLVNPRLSILDLFKNLPEVEEYVDILRSSEEE